MASIPRSEIATAPSKTADAGATAAGAASSGKRLQAELMQLVVSAQRARQGKRSSSLLRCLDAHASACR